MNKRVGSDGWRKDAELTKQRRVGSTTAGQWERRKQSTNPRPTSKQQRFVWSKEALAVPGVFSELLHLLCTVLNIPKESSAGVLVKGQKKKKNRSSIQLQQMKISYCVFSCNWSTQKFSNPAAMCTKTAISQLLKCDWEGWSVTV